MSVFGEKELKAHLKSDEIGGLYLIYGTESYTKDFYAEKLKEKAVSADFADFNYHFFDGTQCTMQDIEQAVEAFPMMSSTSCVFVKDMPIDNMSAAEVKDLEPFLSDVPDYCALIFFLGKTDPAIRKNEKAKRSFALFEKYGRVFELNKKTASELSKLIISGVHKRGSDISRQNADYLVDTVGDDMTVIFNEVEKLSAYATGREITRNDIDLLSIKTLEATAFDLAKYIVSDNFEKAYSVLDILFSQKADEMMIMGAVISAFVDLYRVKIAVAAGHRAEKPAEIFQYRGREFRLRNASRSTASLSVSALRKCLDELHNADMKLKSTAVDNRLVMEEMLVKLILVIESEKGQVSR
ncbi:MAG: DNA polymerase III subunit delta [Oscillospiraceae bacterium]|nr:DNA polymerase III subunit delta [Oscillospiraceae bacterium]